MRKRAFLKKGLLNQKEPARLLTKASVKDAEPKKGERTGGSWTEIRKGKSREGTYLS